MKITPKQLMEIIQEVVHTRVSDERLLDGPGVDTEYIIKTYLSDEAIAYEDSYTEADFFEDYPLADPIELAKEPRDPEQLIFEVPDFEMGDIIAVIRDQKPKGQQWRKIKRVVRRVNRQLGVEAAVIKLKPCAGLGHSVGIVTNIIACRNSPNTVFILKGDE